MSDDDRQADRRRPVREAVPLREHLETVAVHTHDVPLREYVEAVLDEQRRGLVVAEQEREKAARALRLEFERMIVEVDKHLRDHIDAQVEQLRAALRSAELLEVERIDALRRETKIGTDASQEAIAKAEKATDKRLEALNELRSMVTDAQQLFMPREVAEAKIEDLKRTCQELADKLGKIV